MKSYEPYILYAGLTITLAHIGVRLAPRFRAWVAARIMVKYSRQLSIKNWLWKPWRPFRAVAVFLCLLTEHNEPGLCLKCEAEQFIRLQRHVEARYTSGIRCSRCGLGKQYWKSAPKCKGKR